MSERIRRIVTWLIGLVRKPKPEQRKPAFPPSFWDDDPLAWMDETPAADFHWERGDVD